MLYRGANQSLAPADITDTDTVQLATLRILSIASSSQPITVTHAGKSSAASMPTAVNPAICVLSGLVHPYEWCTLGHISLLLS